MLGYFIPLIGEFYFDSLTLQYVTQDIVEYVSYPIKKAILIFLRKKLHFSYLPFYATFQCRRYIIFKNFKMFFSPENLKKLPAKVAHNQANFFFSIANQPKTKFFIEIYFSIMTLIIHTYMQTIDSFYSYSTYSVQIFSEVTLILTFNKICCS